MGSRKAAPDEPALNLAPSATDREPDPIACECGGALVFDPLREGDTVGGLHLIGALVCQRCPKATISRHSRPAGAWKLATSGRSIDADGIRLRAEGGDATAVMARIAKLPDLERALRAIARGDFDPTSIARAALGLDR